MKELIAQAETSLKEMKEFRDEPKSEKKTQRVLRDGFQPRKIKADHNETTARQDKMKAAIKSGQGKMEATILYILL
jgi:hypothetical protein